MLHAISIKAASNKKWSKYYVTLKMWWWFNVFLLLNIKNSSNYIFMVCLNSLPITWFGSLRTDETFLTPDKLCYCFVFFFFFSAGLRTQLKPISIKHKRVDRKYFQPFATQLLQIINQINVLQLCCYCCWWWCFDCLLALSQLSDKCLSLRVNVLLNFMHDSINNSTLYRLFINFSDHHISGSIKSWLLSGIFFLGTAHFN